MDHKRLPSRRDALKQLGTAGAAIAVTRRLAWAQSTPIVIAGQPVEIAFDLGYGTDTAPTVRITLRPIEGGQTREVPFTGALDPGAAGLAARRSPGSVVRSDAAATGALAVQGAVEGQPRPGLSAAFESTSNTLVVRRNSQIVQRLTLSAEAPTMSFLMPKGPLLGLGEGGVQFDKTGSTDQMRNGQTTSRIDGYSLAINGTRAPVQWLIGTGSGWAMFIHQPYGQFDFKGDEGHFTLPAPAATNPSASVVQSTVTTSPFLPLDIFVVASDDPLVIMREYARITGLAAMPPAWSLGYLQSHRTLEGREQILNVAKTFREKKLPCDGLIYLGTDFAPSGWNTHNGEFTWHPTNFPDPKAMIDELHAEHFKVILHIVIEGRTLSGTVADPCTAPPLPAGRTPDNRWPPDRQVSCYWPVHKQLMDVGVDGWWPDQGDGFDGPSRFLRHRMYYDGTRLYRPNDRPFALHRNASPGVQRFGSFIWSGDVQSRWATLEAHVPIGINCGLSGFPYWGTDIGGFYATDEYTGELFVRWFQFGAFNPLFRSHGRNWHLHLPWGWDGGDGGPPETQGFTANPAELHNSQVEIICRKYLELRYRLMPYLYTAVRETCDTGLPIIRALWLHYPDDPAAVGRGDEYLWGRDLLVAPVVQKGATSRRLYLPKGTWIDYWTEEAIGGGREIDRAVDLETTPLYVRAGAIVPTGPVTQYVDPTVFDGLNRGNAAEPLTLTVYPGADGQGAWYEDGSGHGPLMQLAFGWRDAQRTLTVKLVTVSANRTVGQPLRVRVAGSRDTRDVVFTGAQLDVKL